MLLRLTSVVAALAAFTLCAAENATIRGTVTDPSGLAVEGASVTLHEVAGSLRLEATSNASGKFLQADIPPGDYLLDASAPGLTLPTARFLHISAGEARDVDLALVVSAVTGQVSVTGAAEPQSVDQVSKALDVVTAASAERRGLLSISDAARFVPGLRISTRGSPGTFTTIQTRGLRVTDTAILIDGFPFRDPTSVQDEASAYIGDLLLVDTSRIEVLRGSGSSLYGTNAMSGTVNVITNPGGGPTHADLDFQGGGLGLFRGVAHIAGGVVRNRLTYSAGVSHLNVTEGVDGVGAVRDWTGQAAVQYALTPKLHIGTTAFGNTGYLQENVSPSALIGPTATGVIPAIPLPYSEMKLADAGLPYKVGNATFLPSLGDPDAGRYSHFLSSLFRVDHELTSRLSYRLAYGLVRTDRNNTDGPAGPATANYFPPTYNTSSRYTGGVDTAQARINYSIGARQLLTGAYEFSQEHFIQTQTNQNPSPLFRVNNRTETRQRFQSVSAQDEILVFSGRLDLLLSGRFTLASLDQPSFVGGTSPYARVPLTSPPNAYTGDAATSYFFARTATKLRAHAGNAFRMPSMYERFGGYFFGTYYIPIGDPRLSPERAVSIDFGFDQYLFHEHLKLSGTYFYSHLQQVIGYLGFPPGYVDPYGRTGGYYNTRGGLSRGVELAGEFHPARTTTITGSYTYTNAQDRVSQFYTGTGVDPLETPRILPHQVKIVATRDFGKHIDAGMDFDGGSSYLFPLFGSSFTASTAFRFSGPRQLGVSAGYSMPFTESISARFYVRVSNALDQDYYEDGFRTPHRWAVAGIHLSF
ncbi:MAG: TonB-dependent receptor [Acidobacteriaceae bacterium]|nr:TonB-dependent receptor [Acidobacteriaceae bacterium]